MTRKTLISERYDRLGIEIMGFHATIGRRPEGEELTGTPAGNLPSGLSYQP
jgi:hypothetical protein